MTQAEVVTVAAVERANKVFDIDLTIDEVDFKAMVAVKHDDIRTFVVLADAPNSGGLKVRMVYAELVNHLQTLPIVDWSAANVSWGETSWLTHRENMEWRVIRRFVITADGSVELRDWFPPSVAEPLLRALERNVEEPAHLRDDYINRQVLGQ